MSSREASGIGISRGVELRAWVRLHSLRAGHHHRDFTPCEVRVGVGLGRKHRQRSAVHGFENLGQLARHGGATCVAERRLHVFEALGDPMRRFEKNQRARLGRKLREPRAPLGESRRQKAFEAETLGRQAGDGQGRGDRRRPRHGDDVHARLGHAAYQFEARVRKQRRAGITHQRNARATAQLLEQLTDTLRLVVLVQRHQWA